MKRVMVTGCNGFAGSHMCQRLVEEGCRVTGIDIGPYQWRDGYTSLMDSGEFECLQGDITDPEFVSRAVAAAEPGTVIHLASVVGVNHYVADPMRVIEVNILGLKNLLAALRGSGARVVFSSTSEIYGKNPDLPWSEDASRVLGPTWVDRWSYSTSKAAAEHMLWACAPGYGLEAVVVRYFNLYGPRQRPDLIVPAQVIRALRGRDLLVYDGGGQTRCFTCIGDAVEGTLAAAFSPGAAGMSFNIGSDREISIGGITRMIASLAGVGGDLIREINSRDMYGEAYEDIPRRRPDVSRAARILGWRAVTPLEEGLRKTIEWWREILKLHPEI